MKRWICQVKRFVEDGNETFAPDFPADFRPYRSYRPMEPDRRFIDFYRDLSIDQEAEMRKRGNVPEEEEADFKPRSKARESDGAPSGKSVDGVTDLPPRDRAFDGLAEQSYRIVAQTMSRDR